MNRNLVREESPGGKKFQMTALKAGDVMVQEVVFVQSKIDLRELEKIFLERKISGAPVVDQKGALVGVVSQTDLVNFHFQEGDEPFGESCFYEQPHLAGKGIPQGFRVLDTGRIPSVEEVMTPRVITTGEATPITEVAELMVKNRVHRIIITRESRPVGIISAMDLLQLLF